MRLRLAVWGVTMTSSFSAHSQVDSAQQQRSAMPAPAPAETWRSERPAERRFGADFAFTGSLVEMRSDELRRSLAAEGLGQMSNNYRELGLTIGGVYRNLRFGVGLRGSASSVDGSPRIRAGTTSVAPFVGWDFVRWRNMAAFLMLDYQFAFVHLEGTNLLPAFVGESGVEHVMRRANALGLSVGEDFWLTSAPSGHANVGLFMGVRFGYTWQVRQGKDWSFRLSDGTTRPTSTSGPDVDVSGVRAEVRIGGSLFSY